MKIIIKIDSACAANAARAHLMLFCKDTPFKPKRVERKDLYQRKPKHTGKTYE